MKLEIASYKAIRYACLHFHYARRVPSNPITGFSVFNDDNQWCGVVLFNIGNRNLASPFGLQNGEACELVRVALNGLQTELTTKIVSTSVRLFKKNNPCCRLLVSYADSDQGHSGIIYQAMNWHFIGSHKTSDKFIDPVTKKVIHSRSNSPSGYVIQFGRKKKCPKRNDLVRIKTGVKHKYIYPLDKSMIPLCRSLSKPYPKKAVEVHKLNSSQTSETVGGANPTQPLNLLY